MAQIFSSVPRLGQPGIRSSLGVSNQPERRRLEFRAGRPWAECLAGEGWGRLGPSLIQETLLLQPLENTVSFHLPALGTPPQCPLVLSA